MRILVCLLFLFSFFSPNYAISQERKDTVTLDPHVDSNAPLTHAKFPGGKTAFSNYIGLGLEEIKPKRGKIIIAFVVEKDGSLSNMEMLKGKNKKIKTRITELLNNCLKWKPGTVNGEPVRVRYTLPITIN